MNYSLEYLNKLNVHSLRTYAREIGVKAPTTLKKAEIINEILLINGGTKQPQAPTKKGRPANNNINTVNIGGVLEKIKLQEQDKKVFIKYVLDEVEKKLNEIL